MPGRVLGPAATVCANGNHHRLVTHSSGSSNVDARPTTRPCGPLTTRDAYAQVSRYLGTAEYAKPIDEPMGTLNSIDRYALVYRSNSSRGEGAEMITPFCRMSRSVPPPSIESPPRRGFSALALKQFRGPRPMQFVLGRGTRTAPFITPRILPVFQLLSARPQTCGIE
jgi:DNA (cytosine-5)-methyltransferase 1